MINLENQVIAVAKLKLAPGDQTQTLKHTEADAYTNATITI
jgi:hypothetical protein